MSRDIRWGILGTGTIARIFARGLSFAPGSTLWAVGSRSQENAKAFSQSFGVPKSYSSYKELAQDPEVDVIYIATPNSFHKEHCLLCLHEGKAVLCEKPFTLNADEATEIIEMAKRKRLFCMEAMWMRFFPVIQQAKAWIEEGILGDITTLTATLGFPVTYDETNRFFAPNLGGGSLMDLGVYLISLAYFLFGEPAHVYGHAIFAPSGVDEQATMVLEYPNRLAVMTSSLRTEAQNEAIINGTHGRMTIHSPFISPQKVSLQSFAPKEPGSTQGNKLKEVIKRIPLANQLRIRLAPLLRQPTKSVIKPMAGNGFNYEVEEVIRCLKAGKTESQIMPLNETLQIIKAMDSLRAQWEGLNSHGASNLSRT